MKHDGAMAACYVRGPLHPRPLHTLAVYSGATADLRNLLVLEQRPPAAYSTGRTSFRTSTVRIGQSGEVHVRLPSGLPSPPPPPPIPSIPSRSYTAVWCNGRTETRQHGSSSEDLTSWYAASRLLNVRAL